MNIYLISQRVNNEYDTYDSAVVAAETEKAAQSTRPGPHTCVADTWAASEHVTVEYLGVAKPGTKAGVICASYNAG